MSIHHHSNLVIRKEQVDLGEYLYLTVHTVGCGLADQVSEGQCQTFVRSPAWPCMIVETCRRILWGHHILNIAWRSPSRFSRFNCPITDWKWILQITFWKYQVTTWYYLCFQTCEKCLLSPCVCDNLYSIFCSFNLMAIGFFWWYFCLGRQFSVVHGSSAWRSRLGAMGLTGTDAWNFLWGLLRWYSWGKPMAELAAVIVGISHNICHCSRRSQTPNTKLLERVYSQIRRHMLRHKHIGPTRWHQKEDDEDVEHDEHEHDDHGDAKRDHTWRR